MRLVVLRLLLAGAILLALVVGVGSLDATAPAAQTPQASAFGPGDDNASDWAAEVVQVHEVRTLVAGSYLLADAAEPEKTLLVLYAPTRAPTADEADALRDHLASGGSVWLLDPAGAYNPWLFTHGIGVGSDRLVDPASPYGSGTVVVEAADGATATQQAVVRSPASLVLDDETGWQVWLRAPSRVHLDLDANGTIGRIDTPGPHPVGAVLELGGGGRIIVTADASLLSDDMRAMEGARNADVARRVVEEALPDPGLVLIDESHYGWTQAERIPVAAVQNANRALGLSPMVAAGVAAAAAVAAASLVVLARALRPYQAHARSDPVTPPTALEDAAAADAIQDTAWELLALRTRQPIDRLKRAGAAEAAHGLSDDPSLRRALLGEATASDAASVFQSYLDFNNRSNPKPGVKP